MRITFFMIVTIIVVIWLGVQSAQHQHAPTTHGLPSFSSVDVSARDTVP